MLDDVRHVEAVAVVRALLNQEPGDDLPRRAAEQWLRENHPSPEAYLLALAWWQEHDTGGAGCDHDQVSTSSVPEPPTRQDRLDAGEELDDDQDA